MTCLKRPRARDYFDFQFPYINYNFIFFSNIKRKNRYFKKQRALKAHL